MTDRWQRADDVLSRRLPDGVIVLSLQTGDPLVVTGPGGALWDLLAEARTTPDLVAALADRYGKDEGEVRGDIVPLLHDLRDRRLLTNEPATATAAPPAR